MPASFSVSNKISRAFLTELQFPLEVFIVQLIISLRNSSKQIDFQKAAFKI